MYDKPEQMIFTDRRWICSIWSLRNTGMEKGHACSRTGRMNLEYTLNWTTPFRFNIRRANKRRLAIEHTLLMCADWPFRIGKQMHAGEFNSMEKFKSSS